MGAMPKGGGMDNGHRSDNAQRHFARLASPRGDAAGERTSQQAYRSQKQERKQPASSQQRPMPLGVNERRGSTFGNAGGTFGNAGGTLGNAGGTLGSTSDHDSAGNYAGDRARERSGSSAPRPRYGNSRSGTQSHVRTPRDDTRAYRDGTRNDALPHGNQQRPNQFQPARRQPLQRSSFRGNPSYRGAARQTTVRQGLSYPASGRNTRRGANRSQYLRSSSQPLFRQNGWRGFPGSLMNHPRVLVGLLAALILGLGVFTVVSTAQRNAAEAAAQEDAAAEKKRLAAQTVKPSKLGITAAPASTPKSAWQQGTMPHLYQTDPAWANKPYGGGTVSANACGPTCMTMVYVYLTGKTDYDPGSMSAFADANNYAPTGATEWAFMTEGATMLGLTGTNINPTRTNIAAALQAGQPVIASVHAGDFTTTGHYIVLKSIDERGMVEVYDPNSPQNSARRWDIQQVLLQTDNAWAYSA